MSIQEEDKIKNDEKKNEQIINLNEEVVEIMEVEKIIKKGKDKNGNKFKLICSINKQNLLIQNIRKEIHIYVLLKK